MTPAVARLDHGVGLHSYVKELPYANVAYNYNFKPGESASYHGVLDTPFDYAGCEAPAGRGIGAHREQAHRPRLAVRITARQQQCAHVLESFAQHTMYGQGRQLCIQLMRSSRSFRRPSTPMVVQDLDMNRRLVAFQDLSWQDHILEVGFGDGTTSTNSTRFTRIKSGQFVVC